MRAGDERSRLAQWAARLILVVLLIFASPLLLFVALLYGAAWGLAWCVAHA